MERTRQRKPLSDEASTWAAPRELACVSCGVVVEGERCGGCGVARIAGRYRIARVMTQSPRGRMYEARDEAGRRVALKELVFTMVPDVAGIEAFEREGEVLQQLEHPQIPKFVDAFRTGAGVHTRLYLAQEFVEGESLAQRLGQRRFTEAEAKDVARQVLGILEYLHGRSPRLLHRDLKPANLIRRPDGSIVLVDFDAVREVGRDGTHRSTLVGTFGYVPIEQLGGIVDASSDLYALGATLIHLLSGKPPAEMFGADYTLDFERHTPVSPPLRAWLGQLVERERTRRFGNVRAAIAALEQVATTPVRATITKRPEVRPTSLAHVVEAPRPWLWMLLSRSFVALAVLGVVAAIVIVPRELDERRVERNEARRLGRERAHELAAKEWEERQKSREWTNRMLAEHREREPKTSFTVPSLDAALPLEQQPRVSLEKIERVSTDNGRVLRLRFSITAPVAARVDPAALAQVRPHDQLLGPTRVSPAGVLSLEAGAQTTVELDFPTGPRVGRIVFANGETQVVW